MRRGVLALAAALLPVSAWAADPVPVVRPTRIADFPHDPEAFTQGLVLYDGWFYESTGLRGRSTVRRVEPTTGRVDAVTALPDGDFGEGLARIGERLIQLTWQENVAHVYDRATLTRSAQFAYDGEGWGLCFDGTRLIMSDGSSSLFFRDPDSFELIGEVMVTRDGGEVARLNELECVDDLVFANVWRTDEIVRVDPATGIVLTRIDASGLLTPDEARAADVLNGIAHDADSGHFFITGKLWPRLFEVSFDFDRGATDAEPEPSPGPTVPSEPSPLAPVEEPSPIPGSSATPGVPAPAPAPEPARGGPSVAGGSDSTGCHVVRVNGRGTIGSGAVLGPVLWFARRRRRRLAR
jgi:glutaminyl-peptide cyclotransferase